MRMPGFNAEASLYRNSETYWLAGNDMELDTGKVVPAEYVDPNNGYARGPIDWGTIDWRRYTKKCCRKVLDYNNTFECGRVINGRYVPMRCPTMRLECITTSIFSQCPDGYK